VTGKKQVPKGRDRTFGGFFVHNLDVNHVFRPLHRLQSDTQTFSMSFMSDSHLHQHQDKAKAILHWMFQKGLLTFFGRLGVSLMLTTSAVQI